MLFDLLYFLALIALSPWLLWRAATTGRYRREWAAKLLGRVRLPPAQPGPVVWFHAVSVGEIHLLGTLVPAFRQRHPDWRVVVSSTTDSGLAEARRRFRDLPVIAWPFDFSWAVASALQAIAPSLIVLVESELWPNFLAAAGRRHIPVVVVNARLSPRSFRRWCRVGPSAYRFLFRYISCWAAQDGDYAWRLQQLGVPARCVHVTGSIKYDGATGLPQSLKTAHLAELLGLRPRSIPQRRAGGETAHHAENDDAPRPLVWLAGSTHAPEEAIVLDVFARLRVRFPHLRLLLVPRHPDRFDEVARLIAARGWPWVRRSSLHSPLPEMPPVVLLDTVGELATAWGLADVGFTGGSLDGIRGGQSMIEPAGYGVPCLFGPHVWNFRDAAQRLLEAGGAVMIHDAAELEAALTQLLSDSQRRQRMGQAARALVERQQGATARTLELLDRVMGRSALARAA
ncbi:MAG: 3-deoxy-D-manno-octulosonic acid transferase [Gemmataceae bacterium]|nr:3-deoxy-D-manno-octulosonic acid transferase [Gemmata sp.]MDW8197318.1 3-deoxy-D-manno-octulosonic acid transferase [Gemmataceae bacterium]